MEFEIGQTWRTRSSQPVVIVLVGKSRVVVKTENGDYYSVHFNGYYLPAGMGHHGDDLREQILPSKLQLREGAWYKRKDGKVVGPCVKKERDCYGHAWHCASAPYIYYDNGQNRADDSIWLVEEVPDPSLKPVYRPFANADEFEPFREKWIRGLEGYAGPHWRQRVLGYSVGGINLTSYAGTFQAAFEKYEFEDGTPFGVRVS